MASADSTGLVIDRLADVRAALVALAAANLGADVQTGTDSRIGQLLDSFASPLAELWGIVQILADQYDPDSATGTWLDNLCALVGITREPASASRVLLTITGTPTTVVPAGTRYRVAGGVIFATDEEITIPGGGSEQVQATATVTGPFTAASGTVTTIVDSVSGISAVTNASDATPGQNAEDDDSLRIRRETSLRVTGAAADQAIRSRLVELDHVSAAAVISNRTLTTDSNGIPGKSFRAIIWPAQTPAQEVEIARAIWETAPAGIYIDGSDSAVVVDEQGYSQFIRWTVATELDVHVLIDASTDGATAPADAEAQMRAAIVAVATPLSLGDDLRLLMLQGALAGFSWLLEATIYFRVGSTPTTQQATIAADIDEIITIDGGDVTFA